MRELHCWNVFIVVTSGELNWKREVITQYSACLWTLIRNAND